LGPAKDMVPFPVIRPWRPAWLRARSRNDMEVRDRAAPEESSTLLSFPAATAWILPAACSSPRPGCRAAWTRKRSNPAAGEDGLTVAKRFRRGSRKLTPAAPLTSASGAPMISLVMASRPPRRSARQETRLRENGFFPGLLYVIPVISRSLTLPLTRASGPEMTGQERSVGALLSGRLSTISIVRAWSFFTDRLPMRRGSGSQSRMRKPEVMVISEACRVVSSSRSPFRSRPSIWPISSLAPAMDAAVSSSRLPPSGVARSQPATPATPRMRMANATSAP